MDKSFQEMKDGISSALVNTTRTAGQISSEDLAFHRSSNPAIIPRLEEQHSRLLQLTRQLTTSTTSGTEVIAPHLLDADSVEDNWKSIVDVFDSLLEKADACLDEYTGAVRRLSPSEEEQKKTAVPPTGKQRPDKAYRTQNIAKPQLLFEKVPKNDEATPFKPLIRSKPHAITPFEDSLVLVPSSDGSQQYRHPYETEIRMSQYPPEVWVKSNPIPYVPYEDTKAVLVDTPETLMSMLEELKIAKEIAVDLEHHDEHSYIGLVSLMQISTRDKDWIVDTLQPWRQELQVLNEVFTDPNIVKVFHGAYMDMVWLQRDFGLYVVGLFDTFHASRSLGYSRNSLAYLLKRFADFDAAKQYQMADWRIRPLPEEMFNYARSDTHFLLFVYDNMRNELIDNSDASHVDGDLIKMVMSHSRNEALQCYERPFYDMRLGKGTMGWYNLLCRTSGILNREQFAVFRAVHFWRDTVARQEDESIHVIMSKQVLFNIARVTPMDLPSLLGCSHPMSKFFQKRKDELLRIIKQAKKDGATGPEMNDVMETVQPAHAQRELNVVAGGRKAPATGSATHESVLSKLPIRALSLARSGSSVFWGPIVFTEMPSNKRPESWNEGLRLALPLPQLTAELYEDPNSTSGGEIGNNQINLRNLVERQDMKEKDAQQDFFAVQQGGTSRKRKTLELQDPLEPIIRRASSPNQGDDKEAFSPVGSDDPQNEHDERKRLKRAKKMEKRKARSLEKSTLTGTDGGTEGFRRDQPFDYANASSVLHAKRKGNEAQARGNKTENPYLKSMDAPKGLRKTKIENGGNKSFTFKG